MGRPWYISYKADVTGVGVPNPVVFVGNKQIKYPTSKYK